MKYLNTESAEDEDFFKTIKIIILLFSFFFTLDYILNYTNVQNKTIHIKKVSSITVGRGHKYIIFALIHHKL